MQNSGISDLKTFHIEKEVFLFEEKQHMFFFFISWANFRGLWANLEFLKINNQEALHEDKQKPEYAHKKRIFLKLYLLLVLGRSVPLSPILEPIGDLRETMKNKKEKNTYGWEFPQMERICEFWKLFWWIFIHKCIRVPTW